MVFLSRGLSSVMIKDLSLHKFVHKYTSSRLLYVNVQIFHLVISVLYRADRKASKEPDRLVQVTCSQAWKQHRQHLNTL